METLRELYDDTKLLIMTVRTYHHDPWKLVRELQDTCKCEDLKTVIMTPIQ